MRILYVGTLPPHQGGSAISCGELLVGLAGRGHSVIAIAPITEEAAAAGRAFDGAHPELIITRFPVPYFTSNPLSPEPEDYRSSITGHLERLLPGAIARDQPDVMLVGRESFAWTAPGIARRHGVPVVQRLAGTATRALIEGLYPAPLAGELREQFSRADAVVTPGRQLAVALKEDLGLAGVKVIPTGIDLHRFRPIPRDPLLADRWAIAPGDIVVAHVSNLKPVKRAIDVVRSAALALPRDRRLVYLIVGDGQTRSNLEQASHELGLADRVRFTGWRPYEDVPAYLSLADVVAMPSDFEALARVYLETQASGRVLIASDIPAAREVIRDGETGLLFPRGDVDALAAVTLRAAQDPALRERIGRAARAQAEGYSPVRLLDSYEALLGEVAHRRSRATPNR